MDSGLTLTTGSPSRRHSPVRRAGLTAGALLLAGALAGWTAADMEACMLAGTPGKMHEHLVQGAGKWLGKSTMWMGPGGEGMTRVRGHRNRDLFGMMGEYASQYAAQYRLLLIHRW